ncbi:hypothetical protein O3M35_007769 [Rhynocoris fuscipes]|uniref:Major facilitator superfamily (MFS) profile domain-containing protein n=1 Tax=Rhynocoris fuscipes TaxID=488301 RepID=A0AAW1DAQ0_9HEMI
MMATCSSFIWLEPIDLWLISPKSEIKVTPDDFSWLSSCVEVTSFITGLPSGFLADRFGRKILLLSTGPFCFLPWLLAFFTRDLASLYIVRILQGIAEGVCFAVGPTYLAEISSPDIRGTLGGHMVVLMYLGFLFIFMPESPYYYLMKNKREEAHRSLKWLRGGDDVTTELDDIEESVVNDMKRKGNWKDLFATKSDRRAFLIVQIVNIAAYMTGVPTVSMYASQTFATTPLHWITADQMTILMGVILCVSSLLASFVTDTVGKRILLIISSVGITVSNIAICIYYFLAEKTNVQVEQMPWILFVGILGLCLMTNVGVGQLVHIIQGEFFPSHTRSIGGGVTTAIATVAIFVSVKLYQPLSDLSGVYLNFLSYAVISFIATILMLLYVNESTGKTLAQINQDIDNIISNNNNNNTNNKHLTLEGK